MFWKLGWLGREMGIEKRARFRVLMVRESDGRGRRGKRKEERTLSISREEREEEWGKSLV